MWIWANPGRQWRTGKPSLQQSVGSQRVRHNGATEQQRSWSVDPAHTVEKAWMYLLYVRTKGETSKRLTKCCLVGFQRVKKWRILSALSRFCLSVCPSSPADRLMVFKMLPRRIKDSQESTTSSRVSLISLNRSSFLQHAQFPKRSNPSIH